jgi:hypothetical protein
LELEPSNEVVKKSIQEVEAARVKLEQQQKEAEELKTKKRSRQEYLVGQLQSKWDSMPPLTDADLGPTKEEVSKYGFGKKWTVLHSVLVLEDQMSQFDIHQMNDAELEAMFRIWECYEDTLKTRPNKEDVVLVPVLLRHVNASWALTKEKQLRDLVGQKVPGGHEVIKVSGLYIDMELRGVLMGGCRGWRMSTHS